jgi:hypothetical protein
MHFFIASPLMRFARPKSNCATTILTPAFPTLSSVSPFP